MNCSDNASVSKMILLWQSQHLIDRAPWSAIVSPVWISEIMQTPKGRIAHLVVLALI